MQSNSSESKSYSQSPFTTPIRGGAVERAASLSSTEQEQHIAYLKQAFCGFVKAKEAVEMEHLGERHLCAVELIYISVSISLSVSLYLSLTVSISVSLSLPPSLCLTLFLSLSLSFLLRSQFHSRLSASFLSPPSILYLSFLTNCQKAETVYLSHLCCASTQQNMIINLHNRFMQQFLNIRNFLFTFSLILSCLLFSSLLCEQGE